MFDGFSLGILYKNEGLRFFSRESNIDEGLDVWFNRILFFISVYFK